MNDPLEGTPFRDQPGTVRGSSSVTFVKVAWDPKRAWAQIMSDEIVSEWVMHLMNLPVIGAVPGSPAGSEEELTEPDVTRFLAHAREYLYSDSETDDDVLDAALDVLSAVQEQAKRKGQPLMVVARGDDVLCVHASDRDPCTHPLGHEGLHSFEVERDMPDPQDRVRAAMAAAVPRCGDVGGGDPDSPHRCVYEDGHLPPHSYEWTSEGSPRCRAYGDRPCRYRFGHEGRHSYEGKCTERAADGTLCDLTDGHEHDTSHDWMPTFGNFNIRCRMIWTEDRGGLNRIWHCMFPAEHPQPCSFDQRMRGQSRCLTRNKRGARCWRRAGHDFQHHYEEAKR